jgi:ATP-dependent Clp protease adaptor protein ClpS
MQLRMNTGNKPQSYGTYSVNLIETQMAQYQIILHDDDVNTFDHVIDTLIDVCGHNYFQAIQCAQIVHNNGQCVVFQDTKHACELVFDALTDEELHVVIERIKRKK